MAGSLCDYAEDAMIDDILGTTSLPAVTPYLGLHIGDPTDTGAGGTGEVSGTNYIRKAITFAAPGSRAVVQSADVNFDQVGAGGWGTVTHYQIYDAATAGNPIGNGALSSSLLISENDSPTVASGEVDITISANGCSTYLAHAILNHLFRATAYTEPTIYLALCSAAILDADGGGDITELTMTDYVRLAHAAWDASSGGASENTGAATWATALTGSGQTIEAFALTDALTAGTGNVLFYNNTISQALASGNTPRFIDGALDITLD